MIGRLTIDEVPLSESWRVWTRPATVRKVEKLWLAGATNPQLFTGYYRIVDHLQLKAWANAMIGRLSVTAYEAGSHPATRIVYPPEVVRKLTHVAPMINQARWGDIKLVGLELGGPAPAWVTETRATQNDWATPEFQHTDDYIVVQIRTHHFVFGAKQARVVQILHAAELAGEPWAFEKELMGAAKANGNINDLFRRHPNWRELVKRPRHGRYALNVQRPLHPFRSPLLPLNEKERAPWRVAASNFQIPVLE
jgi:hypothetical protein